MAPQGDDGEENVSWRKKKTESKVFAAHMFLKREVMLVFCFSGMVKANSKMCY